MLKKVYIMSCDPARFLISYVERCWRYEVGGWDVGGIYIVVIKRADSNNGLSIGNLKERAE